MKIIMWSSLLHRAAQLDSYKIYFVFVWILYTFLRILEIWMISTASAKRTTWPAPLDRAQVARVAQPTPKMAQASSWHRHGWHVRWTGHHAPSSRGGLTTAGNSAGEAGIDNGEEHWWGKTFQLGKEGGGGAHRSGTTVWRWWFGQTRRHLMVVEARGRWRWAPTSPVDGEGDGGGELNAATKGRRKSAWGGGYHQEQWGRTGEIWRNSVMASGLRSSGMAKRDRGE
jgi:hypothetical protein